MHAQFFIKIWTNLKWFLISYDKGLYAWLKRGEIFFPEFEGKSATILAFHRHQRKLQSSTLGFDSIVYQSHITCAYFQGSKFITEGQIYYFFPTFKCMWSSWKFMSLISCIMCLKSCICWCSVNLWSKQMMTVACDLYWKEVANNSEVSWTFMQE